MRLSEIEIDLQRFRLPGRTERAAMSTGFRPFVGFLLAVTALAVGSFILLVGLRTVDVTLTTVRAPYWILQLFGLIFIVSGLVAGFKTQRQWRQEQRRQLLASEHPGSDAFDDHAWNPRGVRKSPWSTALKAVGASLFFLLFLLPFNWWAWFSGEQLLFVRGVVGLFDLFLLLALFETVRRILVALKYGDSGLDYGWFPMRTGKRVELYWYPPTGLERVNRIDFVLRCVEEWTERRGTDRNRSIDIIHEQLWAATRTTIGLVELLPDQTIPLTYDLPAEALGSSLAKQQHRIFWELDVRADAPGVDFQECYLVPVYAASA